ncbi:MAG: ABC transporter permease [Bdellovibrionota bacterium]|nr:MAG: ABC transporter permease [Bdellovibrionota bacterium]
MISDFAALARHRGLVWALVKRHLALRYRGSALGFLWSFLNPLCLMAVYLVVFQYYMRFETEHNYAIFLFCGLLPWLWVTGALNEGTSSVVSSGHLITKSMFPAHILPTVAVLSNLMNFLFALPLLLLIIYLAGEPVHLSWLYVPGIIVLQTLLLLGLTWALAALNVRLRDVQHITANLLTMLFFLCPILYPHATVPEAWRFTLDWNPFAVLTMMYHAAILEGHAPLLSQVGFVTVVSLGALLIGSLVFDSYRETFAELL